LAARTSSSRGASAAAILLGALAVLAIPAGVVASRVLDDVRLLEAVVISVPVAFVLSLAALSAARRARYRYERSVFRKGRGAVRVGRFLAWAGLYLAITGALALAFYGVLRWVE
jgi:hypothetical protein